MVVLATILAAILILIIGYVTGVRLSRASARWCVECGRDRECLACDRGLILERKTYDPARLAARRAERDRNRR
jgi:hypothetical protein